MMMTAGIHPNNKVLKMSQVNSQAAVTQARTTMVFPRFRRKAQRDRLRQSTVARFARTLGQPSFMPS
jgi:hypothetical protein